MIKIIFFSDTHLGQDFPIRKNVKPKRGQDFFDNFKKVLDYAKESKTDLILHGGDLFFRARIPELIVNKVYKLIYDFSKSNIPFIILPGNHERARFPRSPLINQPGIYVFNYPRKFEFEIRDLNISISGFPYHYDNVRDNFKSVLNEIDKEKSDADIQLLMTHHAVEGCTCGPGNFVFRHNEDVIQMRDIPGHFDAVLCGHIHREQILFKNFEKKELPIVYCGSTERTSFAEINETKGFYEIVIDESLKMIEAFNFMELPSRPMFELVLENDFESPEKIEAYIAGQMKSIKNGCIVRIKIKNEKTRELINLKAIQEKFSDQYFLQFSGLY